MANAKILQDRGVKPRLRWPGQNALIRQTYRFERILQGTALTFAGDVPGTLLKTSHVYLAPNMHRQHRVVRQGPQGAMRECPYRLLTLTFRLWFRLDAYAYKEQRTHSD